MKLRIYADTSTIGGCLDIEFQVPSIRLFEKFKRGEAIVVVSELTLLELASAPAKVRGVLSAVPEAHKEYVDFTPEAE